MAMHPGRKPGPKLTKISYPSAPTVTVQGQPGRKPTAVFLMRQITEESGALTVSEVPFHPARLAADPAGLMLILKKERAK